MRAAYGAKKAMSDLTTQKGDCHLFGRMMVYLLNDDVFYLTVDKMADLFRCKWGKA